MGTSLTSGSPPADPACASPGHTLQRLLEDQAVYAGHVPVRLMLPDRGAGGRGPVTAAQRHHGDQAAQQHVHVQGQPRPEADIPGFQVSLAPAAAEFRKILMVETGP